MGKECIEVSVVRHGGRVVLMCEPNKRVRPDSRRLIGNLYILMWGMGGSRSRLTGRYSS